MDLIKQEADNLRLIDVSMVWINLHKWLNQGHALVSDSLAINRLEHFDEVITIYHRLVNLLIIFPQFSNHLLDLLTNLLLKSVNGYSIDDLKKLL